MPDDHNRSRRSILLGGVTAGAVLVAPDAALASSSTVRHVADRIMDQFDHGWLTGEWDSFLASLTSRFSFWFPAGDWRGRHEGTRGRQAIEEWARFHGTAGNRISGSRTAVTTIGRRVLYEYESRGFGAAEGYVNWEAIMVEVRGSRLSALHEFWGNAEPTSPTTLRS